MLFLGLCELDFYGRDVEGGFDYNQIGDREISYEVVEIVQMRDARLIQDRSVRYGEEGINVRDIQDKRLVKFIGWVSEGEGVSRIMFRFYFR